MQKNTVLLLAGAAALYLLSTNRQGSPWGTGGTSTWSGNGTSPYSRYGQMGTGFGIRPATGTTFYPNLRGRLRRRR